MMARQYAAACPCWPPTLPGVSLLRTVFTTTTSPSSVIPMMPTARQLSSLAFSTLSLCCTYAIACRIVPKEEVSEAVLYGLATSEAPFTQLTFKEGKIYEHPDDVAPVSITFYDEYKATEAPGAFLMSDVYEADLEIWIAINVKDGGDAIYVNTVTEKGCDLYGTPLSTAVESVYAVTSKVEQGDEGE